MQYSGLFGADSFEDDDEDDSEFKSSRYNPVLKNILKALLGVSDEPLSFEDYPSVMPMPESSGGTGTASSARRKPKSKGGVQGSARRGGKKKEYDTAHGSKGKASATSFTGGRTISFTVGGMAYSEMRVARDIMAQESREIIYGSTAFLTAKDFVDALSKLS